MADTTRKGGTKVVANEKVPAIFTSLAKVLRALSVEKNGTLPGSMGGKPYITAVDASAEVKRQFVENNIVILPEEKFTHHEVQELKDRKFVVVGVEGRYTLVSTEDGSTAVVSGVGDGTAIGTSVASNIASTNALKNALLRTFLITEQSVEDEAKSGSESKATPPAVAKAQTVTRATSGKSAKRLEVEKLVKDENHPLTGPLANKFKTEAEGEGLTGDAIYEHILEKAGDL